MAKIDKILKNKKIVLIGGGTGSSVFLRSLKRYTPNITAIVAVSDDGGSSGLIRSNFGIVAPGDIRDCLVALADEESILAELMDLRFTEKAFRKQSFGNILLAAMSKITGSFPIAVQNVADVLAITGKVLPVTAENVILKGEMSTGKIIKGESYIPRYVERTSAKIKRMHLVPKDAALYPECKKAIDEADIVIFCPGSLYTSIIPNLLVSGMSEALANSKANKYWLMNIMTQKGETIGYSLSDHIKAFELHAGEKVVDKIIYNTKAIDEKVLSLYKKEKASTVVIDDDNEICAKYELVGLDIAEVDENKIRHDSAKVWEFIANDEDNR